MRLTSFGKFLRQLRVNRENRKKLGSNKDNKKAERALNKNIISNINKNTRR